MNLTRPPGSPDPTKVHSYGLPSLWEEPSRGPGVLVKKQRVRFVDDLKVRCKTISIVTGPPEPMEETSPEVARRVRRLEAQKFATELTEKGLTQSEVATEMGVTDRTVRRLLRASELAG